MHLSMCSGLCDHITLASPFGRGLLRSARLRLVLLLSLVAPLLCMGVGSGAAGAGVIPASAILRVHFDLLYLDRFSTHERALVQHTSDGTGSEHMRGHCKDIIVTSFMRVRESTSGWVHPASLAGFFMSPRSSHATPCCSIPFTVTGP